MRPPFPFSDGFEIRSQVNQYKRCDVFLCQQDGHKRFDHRVSVYHVLKQKGCYPYGCVSFRWKCSRLHKGSSCPRGFHRVGRMCFGCKFFSDEKIIHRPKFLLPPDKFEAFKRELRSFETWLEGLRGRQVNYSGKVFSVKPHMTIDPSRNSRLSFHGFLVVLYDGFVNLVHFHDFCYLRVSGRTQERYRFQRGDQVDFFARLGESRGRIILTRSNRIDVDHETEGVWLNESRARVALRTGAFIDGQPEKCLNCEKGCLIDVRDERGGDTRIHRRLFCLEGIRDPGICPYVKTHEGVWDECGTRGLVKKDRGVTRSNGVLVQMNSNR